MSKSQKKKLKIGIEAQPLMGKRTGVGNYLKGLVRGLETVDAKNDYVLILFKFMWRKFQPPMSFMTENFGYRLVGIMPGRFFGRLLRYNLLPPLDLFFGKKIYFFANFVRWPLLFSKSVVVIYDLSFIRYPQYTSKRNLSYMTGKVPKSIDKADHVVVISEHTKKEIMEEYGTPASKMTIVTPAVNHQVYYPRSNTEIERVRKKYKLDKHYILFVGTLEPRKNIEGLIEAYSALPADVKKKYQLVIVGGRGWKDESIQRAIKQHKKENIVCTGYVPDSEMPAVYSGATVFAFPTFYEGFGIPPLEAMACGVPVACAKNSSLPEVVGRAGKYFDAANTAQMKDVILQLLNNPEERSKHSKSGLKRAQKFTWEKSAEQLVKVFEKVDKL